MRQEARALILVFKCPSISFMAAEEDGRGVFDANGADAAG